MKLPINLAAGIRSGQDGAELLVLEGVLDGFQDADGVVGTVGGFARKPEARSSALKQVELGKCYF